MLELKDLNFIYHDFSKLFEYGLVSIEQTEENEQILEIAKDRYRRNVMENELVGPYFEKNIQLVERELGFEKGNIKEAYAPVTENISRGKIYALERVS